MRLEVQEGFVTNSSSTTYCNIVVGATFEDFLKWLGNLSEYETEDLITRKKDLFKSTLECFHREVDYDVESFVVDMLDIKSVGLSLQESEFIKQLENDRDSDAWVRKYVTFKDGKYIWSPIPPKVKKLFGKMVKAFYNKALEHFTCGSHGLENGSCDNTKQPYIGSLWTVYDADYDEIFSGYMNISLEMFAQTNNLIAVSLSEYS